VARWSQISSARSVTTTESAFQKDFSTTRIGKSTWNGDVPSTSAGRAASASAASHATSVGGTSSAR